MSLESARLALPFIAAGQAQKELTHNEALALIDAGLAAAAESAGSDEPPAAAAAGQCWVVGAAPTGLWTGHADELACWTDGGWRFLPAVEGMRVWLKDQRLWAAREAGGWAIGSVRGARLIVDGVQVVGARGAAVAPPTGGGVIDAEARSAIASILDRLIAHGLIGG
ncbi:DUF2793 domain-containing protein [Sphingomonas sp. MAH-20]|jgi:hypothetical protein|uniref:DUF2793 domain-containing protein n=1 Tax=Sphingomonas horti TaxID=2682842 RepID=A0A6I4J049_9SPHN|nr:MULTISPECIES: DUF2793 domain-containing protein [Sphingomonas]MBA2920052.1 DUF2793 domain-containing protein [Sphingomonas sp. CGMCC 1.13658]MVO77932.1 DUF2793 domain-containing protein [Sphingomonas horti]